jgi:bifunctional enzyme CysN/CysC/sulfate adenylyltransferase subunit 1
MDAVHYDEQVFNEIKNEYSCYLESLNVKPGAFIPVSAREGKNVSEKSAEMSWYTGKTILEALDSFHNLPSNENLFFAMPLQDIYRFSNDNDDRRIYAGTIVSGEIKVGDAVRFLPSNKEAHIKKIEVWNVPGKTTAQTGDASGFTLEEEIYVKRGEVMVKADEDIPVHVVSRIKANLIWLGLRPLAFNKSYLLKLGSAKVEARLEKIERFLGGEGRDTYNELRRHDCGSVILNLSRPIAVSSFYENASLGRFVIVDGYDAAGGGIVLSQGERLSKGERLSLGELPETPQTGEGHELSADFEEELFALLKKYFPHRF